MLFCAGGCFIHSSRGRKQRLLNCIGEQPPVGKHDMCVQPAAIFFTFVATPILCLAASDIWVHAAAVSLVFSLHSDPDR